MTGPVSMTPLTPAARFVALSEIPVSPYVVAAELKLWNKPICELFIPIAWKPTLALNSAVK